MKRLMIIFATLVLFPISSAFAQHDGMDMSGMDMGSASSKATTSEGVGVVESVEKTKGKLTISHEPIASLNWPAMTMDFVVNEKKLINKIIAGNKVNFQFVKQGGQYLITDLKLIVSHP